MIYFVMVTKMYNVLSIISAKADPRTRARLRVLDKRTHADPLLAGRGPLRTAYAFGTGGALQKMYNDMPRMLGALKAALSGNEELGSESDTVDEWIHSFMWVKKRYVAAAKSGKEVMMTPAALPQFLHNHFSLTSWPELETLRMTVPMDPERFMTVILRYLSNSLREMSQVVDRLGHANLSRATASFRRVGKAERRTGFVFDRVGGAAGRKARHVASRAARRLHQ